MRTFHAKVSKSRPGVRVTPPPQISRLSTFSYYRERELTVKGLLLRTFPLYAVRRLRSIATWLRLVISFTCSCISRCLRTSASSVVSMSFSVFTRCLLQIFEERPWR